MKPSNIFQCCKRTLFVSLFFLCSTATWAETAETAKSFHYTSVFGIQLIRIPSGIFSIDNSQGEEDEKSIPATPVKSFLLGKYPITQSQWHAVMGNNPSHYKGPRRPVENISWQDAQDFIQKLNLRIGRHFRLPTEIEWEYAARAGKPRKPGKIDIMSINLKNCFECGNRADADRTASVGHSKPNTYGLYDMHGEIVEWVQNRNHEKDEHSTTETNRQESSPSAMDRSIGGSWGFKPGLVSSSFKDGHDDGYRGNLNGFRLVLDQ